NSFAMKISKSLLQAIFAGVTLAAAATSCDHAKEEISGVHFSTCQENCTIDHALQLNEGGEGNSNTIPDNCIACGRG
ncbi:MAG TPA: hypothetical protein PLM41_18865, partial [Saprospiraceae bacterium]|nr:hypothetical protein [Saprospiraceae bacterium]